MSPLRESAEQRFRLLWEAESHTWVLGEVSATPMEHGAIVPVDYCLSTIARVIRQGQPDIDQALAWAQGQIRAVSPGQFFYPPESLHISLQGCTPRAPSPETFSLARMQKIEHICRDVLASLRPVSITLHGLNISGPQVFVQGFLDDWSWPDARDALEKALIQNGEEPTAKFADKTPIHLNLVRITDSSHAQLARILEVVGNMRSTDLGQIRISLIEYLLTDFVVSPTRVRFLSEIRLAHPTDML